MNYKIAMHPSAWDLFWAYVDLMPGEVGCFGYATLDPAIEEVYVSEIFLVPQEASAAQVDFVEDGLPYAIEKAIADGKLDELRFCIHSHGDFGAAWSKTDEEMIRKIGHDAEWFASVIMNKDGASTGRIDTYNLPPFGKMQVTIKDLDVVCARSLEYDEKCLADLERFVKKPAPKPLTSKGTAVTRGGSSMITPLSWEVGEKALTKAMEQQQHVDVAGLARACGWQAIDDNGITCYYDRNNSDVWVETMKIDTRQEYILCVGYPDHAAGAVEGSVENDELTEAIMEGAL